MVLRRFVSAVEGFFEPRVAIRGSDANLLDHLGFELHIKKPFSPLFETVYTNFIEETSRGIVLIRQNGTRTPEHFTTVPYLQDAHEDYIREIVAQADDLLYQDVCMHAVQEVLKRGLLFEHITDRAHHPRRNKDELALQYLQHVARNGGEGLGIDYKRLFEQRTRPDYL